MSIVRRDIRSETLEETGLFSAAVLYFEVCTKDQERRLSSRLEKGLVLLLLSARSSTCPPRFCLVLAAGRFLVAQNNLCQGR